MPIRNHPTVDLSPELAHRLLDIARYPFATSAELFALTGRALQSNVHRNVAALRDKGVVQSVDHHSRINGRASSRQFPACAGLRVLSELLGRPEAATLRELPVSAEWQKTLLGRIDIIALVYRIAVQVARYCADSGSDGPVVVHFPRDDALDGIISCADGRWFGVMRQGYGLSLSKLGARIEEQARKATQPDTLFVATADRLGRPPIERRVFERRARVTGLVAFEDEILVREDDEEVWTRPGYHGGGSVSLKDVVMNAVGSAIYRPTMNTSYTKASRPTSFESLPENRWAELTAAERLTFDDVFLWPLMDVRQLAALRGVQYANKALVLSRLVEQGLTVRMKVRGIPRGRFALSDGGLRFVSSRDRTSLSDLRKQWRPGSDREPAGTMLAKMQLECHHTEGVNDFAARLMTELGTGTHIMPSHRGMRHFTDRVGDSLVSPDLIASFSLKSRRKTLLLEYEMRAASPNPMRDKILPWLRYFGTPYPCEDFEGDLRLLFVLAGEKEETVFHEVTSELHRRTGLSVPLATTHKDLLDQSTAVLHPHIWRSLGRRPGERTAALSTD